MLRFAILAFSLFLVVLTVVSLLPEEEELTPDTTIKLQKTRLTLYPQADSEAVWEFEVDDVNYRPESREAELLKVDNGSRTVNDEIDFTVQSDKLVIDSADNIRGNSLLIHLVEADWDLEMLSKEGRQVLIDQNQGRFEAPTMHTIDGADKSVASNVTMNFDLTNYSDGGPNTIGYTTFRYDTETSTRADTETESE